MTDKSLITNTVITGSSNLSLAGLKGQFEVNVVLHDKRDYNEARELFDFLWQSAYNIADLNCFPDFQEHVSNKIWFEGFFRNTSKTNRTIAEKKTLKDEQMVIIKYVDKIISAKNIKPDADTNNLEGVF